MREQGLCEMATNSSTIHVRRDGEDVAVDVRYTTTSSGWRVRRADNGRPLGWLTRSSWAGSPSARAWEARVSEAAFRGDGPDDLGDRRDEVPARLSIRLDHRTSSKSNGYVAIAGNRDEATAGLLSWLVRHRAPAVGFGRHPDVVRHDG